ncbi:LVIVD repeat-containing protein [Xanthovirga aplysinae]|uniref:LVIVD repeat-containing protein n=1 Tax=Xanthovirga aplysinae TaxID=2529853 RepID=UPI0012BC518F|nr:hypothetical protein [Xanthovirga aplysinae]MTI31022.1 hypothetical protein [Xanthovirga aplysinae]
MESPLYDSIFLFISCSDKSQDPEPKTEVYFEKLSHLEIPRRSVTDVWGYETQGKEYAIIGDKDGISIVDVTEPSNTEIVSTTSVFAFDMKVWDHYLYVADGDLSKVEKSHILDISDPSNPKIVGTFPSSHNIFIDEKGYLYLTGYFDNMSDDDPEEWDILGFSIFDLNENPENPRLIWTFEDERVNSHDFTVNGNRMYAFQKEMEQKSTTLVNAPLQSY